MRYTANCQLTATYQIFLSTLRMSRQLKGKRYDVTALERAVQVVTSKSMGYLKASKYTMYLDAPLSTKYTKIRPLTRDQGPHTVLSSEGERLTKWLVNVSQTGYGRSKQKFLATVRAIIKAETGNHHSKTGDPRRMYLDLRMSRRSRFISSLFLKELFIRYALES